MKTLTGAIRVPVTSALPASVARPSLSQPLHYWFTASSARRFHGNAIDPQTGLRVPCHWTRLWRFFVSPFVRLFATITHLILPRKKLSAFHVYGGRIKICIV